MSERMIGSTRKPRKRGSAASTLSHSGSASAARGAVSHLPRFTVPHLDYLESGNHARNLAALADKYRAMIQTMFGKRSEPTDWQYQSARDQASEATCPLPPR